MERKILKLCQAVYKSRLVKGRHIHDPFLRFSKITVSFIHLNMLHLWETLRYHSVTEFVSCEFEDYMATHLYETLNTYNIISQVGRDGSVGIANHFGLDGPWIESPWGRDFPHPSRPPQGPASRLYNGYRVFPRGKAGQDVAFISHPIQRRS
jgi:hypothetical protein